MEIIMTIVWVALALVAVMLVVMAVICIAALLFLNSHSDELMSADYYKK